MGSGIGAILLIVAIVIVAGLSLAIAKNIFNITQPAPVGHNTVNVTGIVKTTGLFTKPVDIAFVNVAANLNYTTSIAPNGQYYISLPGDYVYNASVYYKGAVGGVSTSSNCSKNISIPNNPAETYFYNVTC